MKRTTPIKLVLTALFALHAAFDATATMIVTQQTYPSSLVNALVPSGSGLTTSSIGSGGQIQQRGTFTALSTDKIGTSEFTSGIILSSGNVSLAHTNSSNVASVSNTGDGGDADFDALLSSTSQESTSLVRVIHSMCVRTAH